MGAACAIIFGCLLRRLPITNLLGLLGIESRRAPDALVLRLSAGPAWASVPPHLWVVDLCRRMPSAALFLAGRPEQGWTGRARIASPLVLGFASWLASIKSENSQLFGASKHRVAPPPLTVGTLYGHWAKQ